MPEIDGIKVAVLIKSIENIWYDEILKPGDICRHKTTKKHCPIVAVTTSNEESIIKQAFKVGINRVL
jgi:CheY-like chemotaxis protein